MKNRFYVGARYRYLLSWLLFLSVVALAGFIISLFLGPIVALAVTTFIPLSMTAQNVSTLFFMVDLILLTFSPFLLFGFLQSPTFKNLFNAPYEKIKKYKNHTQDTAFANLVKSALANNPNAIDNLISVSDDLSISDTQRQYLRHKLDRARKKSNGFIAKRLYLFFNYHNHDGTNLSREPHHYFNQLSKGYANNTAISDVEIANYYLFKSRQPTDAQKNAAVAKLDAAQDDPRALYLKAKYIFQTNIHAPIPDCLIRSAELGYVPAMLTLASKITNDDYQSAAWKRRVALTCTYDNYQPNKFWLPTTNYNNPLVQMLHAPLSDNNDVKYHQLMCREAYSKLHELPPLTLTHCLLKDDIVADDTKNRLLQRTEDAIFNAPGENTEQIVDYLMLHLTHFNDQFTPDDPTAPDSLECFAKIGGYLHMLDNILEQKNQDLTQQQQDAKDVYQKALLKKSLFDYNFQFDSLSDEQRMRYSINILTALTPGDICHHSLPAFLFDCFMHYRLFDSLETLCLVIMDLTLNHCDQTDPIVQRTLLHYNYNYVMHLQQQSETLEWISEESALKALNYSNYDDLIQASIQLTSGATAKQQLEESGKTIHAFVTKAGKLVRKNEQTAKNIVLKTCREQQQPYQHGAHRLLFWQKCKLAPIRELEKQVQVAKISDISQLLTDFFTHLPTNIKPNSPYSILLARLSQYYQGNQQANQPTPAPALIETLSHSIPVSLT